MRRVLLALSLTVALAAWLAPARSSDEGPSVVLFIGDGMGASQITLGRACAEKLGKGYALDRFQTIGLCRTRAFDNLVTESSAAATALATGHKTRNRTIGVDEEGRPLYSIVQAAHAAGVRTGLVTTARVTDSTPAAFVAH